MNMRDVNGNVIILADDLNDALKSELKERDLLKKDGSPLKLASVNEVATYTFYGSDKVVSAISFKDRDSVSYYIINRKHRISGSLNVHSIEYSSKLFGNNTIFNIDDVIINGALHVHNGNLVSESGLVFSFDDTAQLNKDIVDNFIMSMGKNNSNLIKPLLERYYATITTTRNGMVNGYVDIHKYMRKLGVGGKSVSTNKIDVDYILSATANQPEFIIENISSDGVEVTINNISIGKSIKSGPTAYAIFTVGVPFTAGREVLPYVSNRIRGLPIYTSICIVNDLTFINKIKGMSDLLS